MSADYLTSDVDPQAAHSVADRGLRLDLVEDTPEAFENWIQAVARGFLDSERTPEEVEAIRARSGYRRKTVVRDPDAAQPERPVATLASWPSELSLPGGAAVDAGAISSVTVAPTHRRRGIARALVEGELRFLVGRGIPIAVLTVSESTLYGRYGFAPAASVAEITIESRRAGWAGPEPTGRIDFVSRERFRELAPAMHDRVRRRVPGELRVPLPHWDTFAGLNSDAKEPGKLRAIQHRDDAGTVDGLALYTVTENHDDFTKSRVNVVYLLADTPPASAALWRFLLSLDLVAEVTAHEQPVDMPLLWMVADRRAVTVDVRDHHYLRILDVARVLTARTYSAPGRFRLRVDDPLGLTGGVYLLTVGADGVGTVDRGTAEDAVPAEDVALGIAELSALVLGGVSPTTLADAGRLASSDVEGLARTFSWSVAPRLSFWY